MSIKDLFLKLTKSTMPGGHESLVEQYLPKGWKKDFHGNYYIKIGDPTTMFASHVDTADTGQPKDVVHVIEGDVIKTDGKTILGADDKAGTAIMIHMIEKGITGLYYFFLNEERGCVGSRALNTYLDTHKDDALYKKITKVVSLDRRDFDSVITFQVGERCCSDEFADELAKRLNAAGGFKYKKDPTGAVTDSHQVAEKFSECTNLSVGYDRQHMNSENQNIAFLTKLADACCKIDWETLPVKRDQTKTEYSYSTSKRSKYYGSEWDNDRWWEGGGYSAPVSSRTSNITPSNLPRNAEFVTDYMGNQIRVADAQWCEYDKVWVDKKEAIWVDYVGFYTAPDFDPSKVKKAGSEGELVTVSPDDIKKNLTIYSKNGELFGTITDIDDKNVTISTEQNSKFICPPNKFLTYGFKTKSGGSSTIGGKKLTINDLKTGLPVLHPGFGEGKIIAIRPDNIIVKVLFKDKGEKDLRVDVADMKF